VTYGITELTAQTIARGHSADSAWVLYPDTVADFDKSFEVRGGKETKLVEVTAASVPMSQPDSGFQLSASTSDLASSVADHLDYVWVKSN